MTLNEILFGEDFYENLKNELLKGVDSEISFQEIKDHLNLEERMKIMLLMSGECAYFKLPKEKIIEYYENTRDIFDSRLHNKFFDIARRHYMIDLNIEDNFIFDELTPIKTFVVNNCELHMSNNIEGFTLDITLDDVYPMDNRLTSEEALFMLKEGYPLHPYKSSQTSANTLYLNRKEAKLVDANFIEKGSLDLNYMNSLSNYWSVGSLN